eukprot:360674-Chlamydomonas_euryale.AAC.5
MRDTAETHAQCDPIHGYATHPMRGPCAARLGPMRDATHPKAIRLNPMRNLTRCACTVRTCSAIARCRCAIALADGVPALRCCLLERKMRGQKHGGDAAAGPAEREIVADCVGRAYALEAVRTGWRERSTDTA